MNLADGNYTHDQVWDMLTKSKRNVYYEYSVHDNSGKTLGYLTKCEGKISFDATSSVMRTFSGTASKSELLDINLIDERVIPWFCLEIGKKEKLKFPLGKFIISPSYNLYGSEELVNIKGYDLGKLALDDKIDSRFVVKTGSYYTNEIQSILSKIYPLTDIVAFSKSKNSNCEWSPGTSKLKIVNDLLTAINYYPLHFDEYGIPKAIPYVFPEENRIDAFYKIGKESVILPDLTLLSNRFDIPNKFVRYVENVDGSYLVSRYINQDPNDIFSTINRGRVITDISSVPDISSQNELDNYVKRCAVASMTVNDKVIFKTLNMPGHGFKNCIFLEIKEQNIYGKYIENGWEMDLRAGGEMTHRCVKAVKLS